MGCFNVRIEVGDPQGTRFQPVEALVVDTGSTHSVMPAAFLRELGVVPYGREEFVLADDRVANYEVGQAAVRIGDLTLTTQVVFAENGGQALLGAVTLEQFGLAVDTVNQQLIRVRKLLKGLR